MIAIIIKQWREVWRRMIKKLADLRESMKDSLTPDQRDRYEKELARLDILFAPVIQAIEESENITSDDLGIVVR
jgi:hypothetical protein